MIINSKYKRMLILQKYIHPVFLKSFHDIV
jgi:hypothetical protein